jgi:NAD(P)-dependent dehydrogenase (short-subunit alcohol dehydrogenase family)
MNILDKFSLKNRTAIVTGGAMGLGYAMAEAMAQAGANILVADINLKAAEPAARELCRFGTVCKAVYCDVTDESSAGQAVLAACEQLGGLDILLNNAGISIHADSQDMLLSDWKKIMSVNLDGIFIMSKAAARVMIANRKGAIVNISSMSGLIVNTPQNQSAYNASKAGVIHLTKSLAAEWAPYNIRVNTIAPGYMVTPMTQPVFDENGEMVKRWMSMSPMKRPGQPEELGGAIVYFASDASSFTTGAVLSVDGGYTCW